VQLGLGLKLGSFFHRAQSAQPSIPLQGLSLWLKADAGVDLDGTNVLEWADQSGNGNTAYPNDVYPVFNSSDLNGKPTITLSDTSDNRSFYLSQNPAGPSGSTAFVVNYVDPVVFSEEGVGGDPNGALIGNLGAAADGSHWPYGLSNSVYDSFCTDTRKDDLGLPAGIDAWNIYSVHSENNNWKLFCNGDMFAEDNSNIYSGDIAAEEGPFIGMQTNAGSAQIFKGKVAEIVVFSRVLTTAERSQVESYLNAKYGIY
jgi:hypothetical protein